MANAHKRYNHIERLVVNEVETDDPEEIKKEAVTYFQELYSEDETWRTTFNLLDGNISAAEQEELQKEFGEEEVFNGLKLCATEKATGPDGFTMGFFIACWDIVKHDILSTMNNFHSQEYFEKSFNATYVVLIPKKNGAKELKDFRPISLIGSIYKISSKVLTKRLKIVMDKLVNNQQMAFIRGRQIMDAALIANECVDSRTKSKEPGLLRKLDIQKAYDHVNWNFLLKIMKDMGFGEKWLGWIKFCISTVKFSILVNGSPEGFFPSQRGLRQGDPLSPFLFILAMEGFNNMMMRAVQNEWIMGFKVNNRIHNSLTISHLLYADDTLVFCEATMENVMHLRLILTIFEGISGLHVNWEKSTIFPVNDVSQTQVLAGILGCKIGSLPTTYLGLALGAKRNALEIWNEVLERCERKLAIWKAQYLSLGGRVVLINSVLDALLTYVMSLFSLPVKVEKRLNALRRKFLWQGNSEKRAINLVRWDTVIKHKKMGGLGIKNLRVQNKSLLTKWLWRYTTEEQALWRNMISQKYGKQDEWCTKPVVSAYGVANWKAIRRLWEDFKRNISFKHGDGRRIAFWNDNWVGHGPLRDIFPEIFTLSTQPDAKIREVRDEHGWNLSLRRSLNDWEITRMTDFLKTLEAFAGLNENQDTVEWFSDRRTPFSVRAAYISFANHGQQRIEWPWKQIWKTQVPYKVACFSWLVTKRACLTQENLQRRGFQLPSRCFLCYNFDEDNSHLFLHCPVTLSIWHLFLNLAAIKWCMPRDTEELMKSWNQIGRSCRQQKWWRVVPHCIWWTVWKERNSRCFEDRGNPFQKVKFNCIVTLHFWCKQHLVDQAESILQFLEEM